MRPMASLLMEETNLTKYQAAYTAENQKMPTPAYKIADLIPATRKHTFPPKSKRLSLSMMKLNSML